MASYIVDGKPGFYSSNMKYLEWTTEPPRVAGWYWVYVHHNKFPSGPSLVEVKLSDGALGTWSGGDFEPVEDYAGELLKAHWLGPLPMPEPPQKGE
jgi:hypothetical protein